MKKIVFYVVIIVLLFSLISCNGKTSTGDDEAAIQTIYKEFCEAVIAKDLNKIMSFYAPGDELLAFDAFIPRQYKGAAAYRKSYEDFFVSFPGPSKSTILDVNIRVSGNLAYASSLDQWTITDADNKSVDML